MATTEERPVNDRKEGIVRDPVNYQGQVVSYVKDIGNGDPGYDAGTRKVLIMLQDGTEKVVPEIDILRERRVPMDAVHELDRLPEETLPKENIGDREGENLQARSPQKK